MGYAWRRAPCGKSFLLQLVIARATIRLQRNFTPKAPYNCRLVEVDVMSQT